MKKNKFLLKLLFSLTFIGADNQHIVWKRKQIGESKLVLFEKTSNSFSFSKEADFLIFIF